LARGSEPAAVLAEAKLVNSDAMAGLKLGALARGRVPPMNGGIETGRHNALAVRADRQRQHILLHAAEGEATFAGCGFKEPDGAILARRCQPFAVRAEGDGVQ